MCERRLWGLAGGLRCTGAGLGHTHQYEASSPADRHDETATDAEATS